MKNRIFALLLTLLFLSSPFIFASCGKDDDEVVTSVRFSVYEKDGTDMVSFYMTSDTKPYGVWEYTIENELFEIFDENEETNDYGLFGMGGTASYRTLILTPVKEGEATISFKLTEGDMKHSFSVKVTKDGDSFKIEAKEI